MRDPHGDRRVLCFDYISINVLGVMLYYRFAVCFHRQNLDKTYRESLNIISYNNMRIYNFTKIKRLTQKQKNIHQFIYCKKIKNLQVEKKWFLNSFFPFVVVLLTLVFPFLFSLHIFLFNYIICSHIFNYHVYNKIFETCILSPLETLNLTTGWS